MCFEVIRARTEGAYLFCRIVGQLLNAQLLAIGVQLVDQVCGDFNGATIDVVFAPLWRGAVGDNGSHPRLRSTLFPGLCVFLSQDLGRNGLAMLVDLLLRREDRLTVKVTVSEVARGRSC